MRDVVWHKIVSQPVAFVKSEHHNSPVLGLDCQPASSIPDPVRVYAHLGAVRIEPKMSARFFSSGVVSGSSTFVRRSNWVTNIFLPSAENLNVAGPMPFAMRQVYNALRWLRLLATRRFDMKTARLHRCRPHISTADCSWEVIERDAIRLVESGGEYARFALVCHRW